MYDEIMKIVLLLKNSTSNWSQRSIQYGEGENADRDNYPACKKEQVLMSEQDKRTREEEKRKKEELIIYLTKTQESMSAKGINLW